LETGKRCAKQGVVQHAKYGTAEEGGKFPGRGGATSTGGEANRKAKGGTGEFWGIWKAREAKPTTREETNCSRREKLGKHFPQKTGTESVRKPAGKREGHAPFDPEGWGKGSEAPQTNGRNCFNLTLDYFWRGEDTPVEKKNFKKNMARTTGGRPAFQRVKILGGPTRSTEKPDAGRRGPLN